MLRLINNHTDHSIVLQLLIKKARETHTKKLWRLTATDSKELGIPLRTARDNAPLLRNNAPLLYYVIVEPVYRRMQRMSGHGRPRLTSRTMGANVYTTGRYIWQCAIENHLITQRLRKEINQLVKITLCISYRSTKSFQSRCKYVPSVQFTSCTIDHWYPYDWSANTVIYISYTMANNSQQEPTKCSNCSFYM